MLRNLLVLVKQRWGLDRVQILRYRDVQSKRDQGRSMVIRLESKPVGDGPTAKPQQTPSQMPKITGWERNPAGKLAGRIVNLTEYMDPARYSHSHYFRSKNAGGKILISSFVRDIQACRPVG